MEFHKIRGNISRLTVMEKQPLVRARPNDYRNVFAPRVLGEQFRIFWQKALFALVWLNGRSEGEENIIFLILSNERMLN